MNILLFFLINRGIYSLISALSYSRKILRRRSSGTYLLLLILLSGVRLSPLGTAATTGLTDADCGAINGMKIGRENRSTRRKPVPAPLFPPQIPHDQTRGRTQAAAVGSQRLTA
jgi:hypothetical protein